jgi:drug/metabolite transporter (DMT)-like permease
MNSVATASPLSDTREPGWLTPLELAQLGAIWGASFLFMPWPPATSVRCRWSRECACAGLICALPFLVWRARAQFRRSCAEAAIIGRQFGSALHAVRVGGARAPAGVGAIANAMTVLFTALVGFLFFGEKIADVA